MAIKDTWQAAKRLQRLWSDAVAGSSSRLYGTRDHADFLPAALSVAETPPHPLAGWTIKLVAALLAGVVLWSTFGQVDIVARATGQTITTGRLKVVQAMETVRVRQLLVREGQKVDANQPLVRLDPTVSTADVSRLRGDAADAAVRMAVAATLLERSGLPRPGALPAVYERASADFEIEAEWANHRSTMAKLESDISTILAQRQANLAELSGLQRRLPLLRQRNAGHAQLVEKGYYPKLRLLDETSELYAMEDQLAVRQGQDAELAARLQAATSLRDGGVQQFRTTIIQRYHDAKRTVGAAGPELDKAQWRLDGMVLRSPVDGVVQKVSATTVGQIVQGGEPIVEVVSTGRPILVEVQILNRDRGFVREGQPANVAFDAFPPNRFGVVKGEVVWISADAESVEELGLIYRARIELKPQSLAEMPGEFTLTPGLRATADIRTGRRRIIEFFFAPITNAIRSALRER